MRGNASSEAQKDLTTEYAKDVEGVEIVKNEVKTLSAAMKPGDTNLVSDVQGVK